ncbi:unnamed protein product [Urochloa humidicola]
MAAAALTGSRLQPPHPTLWQRAAPPLRSAGGVADVGAPAVAHRVVLRQPPAPRRAAPDSGRRSPLSQSQAAPAAVRRCALLRPLRVAPARAASGSGLRSPLPQP